mmetsp:Transcript_925/g.2456  ORF Transcript_925/g.2456 Transcript_925/m.2456 type:complete len:405 (-) Transcript_925:155-1369(-)
MQHQGDAEHAGGDLVAEVVLELGEGADEYLHKPVLHLSHRHDAGLRGEQLGLGYARISDGHVVPRPSVCHKKQALVEATQSQTRNRLALQPRIQQSEGLLEARVRPRRQVRRGQVEAHDGVGPVYLRAVTPLQQGSAIGDHRASVVVHAANQLPHSLADRDEVLQAAVQGAALRVGHAAVGLLSVDRDAQVAAGWRCRRGIRHSARRGQRRLGPAAVLKLAEAPQADHARVDGRGGGVGEQPPEGLLEEERVVPMVLPGVAARLPVVPGHAARQARRDHLVERHLVADVQEERDPRHPRRDLVEGLVLESREGLPEQLHEPRVYLPQGQDARLRCPLGGVRDQKEAGVERTQAEASWQRPLHLCVQQAEGLLPAGIGLVLARHRRRAEPHHRVRRVDLPAKAPA